ncbi:metallophosphoesterase [bacterium]|nr:metallophosphoesterase [bacterium]
MRPSCLRQPRNTAFYLCLALVLSCVSRTTPEGRVAQSLAVAADTEFIFNTSPANQFTFAMVGDLHIGQAETSRLGRILDAAAGEGAEFILFLGDIVDAGKRDDVAAFHQEIANRGWTGKTFSVAGNHDIFEDGWDNYRELTGPSTYTFKAGNSRFIALDTADATLGEAQINWLRQTIDSAAEDNIFLFSHYLPVIPGQSTYLKLASETESLRLMALATQKGVRGWFGAHYHSYMQAKIAGVDYVVAGGGGGRRMLPTNAFFFVRADVSDTTVTYTLKPIP